MRGAVAACAALAALWLLAPLAPEPETLGVYRVYAYGTAALFFAVLGWAVAALLPVGAARSGRWLAAAAAIGFAVVMALNVADIEVASDLAKVLFATAAGIGMVRAIERPWWLLPVAVLVPLADAWSVFSSRGVTNAVVAKAAEEPRWIDWPTIATPIAGLPYEGFGRLGVVDVFFLAIFLAAAARWGLGLRVLVVALPLTFVATIVVVNEWIDTAVPALPLLCVVFVVIALPGLVRDLRAELRGEGPPPGPAAPEPPAG